MTTWNIYLTQLKYKVVVKCTLFLPYGCTSCDYIRDVTILSWFYDPSGEDSHQAGHSLSFSGRSESSLSAWRNLRSLPTHCEISRGFSTKSRGVSLWNVMDCLRALSHSFSMKFCGENPQRNKQFLFFSAKKFILCKGCSAAKREKWTFFLGWSVFTVLHYFGELIAIGMRQFMVGETVDSIG